MKRALKPFSLPLNVVFLYLEIAGGAVLGYVYWFAITKLAGADILGTVSAMASFATLITILMGVGIPAGATIFLGKAYAERQDDEFSMFFTSSLISLGVSSLLGVAVVLLLRGQLQTLIGLPVTFLYLACLVVFLTGIASIFRTVFICVQRAQVIPFSMILGGVARLGVGIPLVLLGWGALGAGIGYTMVAIINFVLLLGFLKLGPISLTQSRSTFNVKAAKEVINAGSVYWMPRVMLNIGSQLGILIVYGIRGAAETGFYFIAYAIFSVVQAIPMSIWGAMFPVLSGMSDGRKRLTWRGIKLGLAVTVPIAVSLFLCSKVILGFFGSEFLLADRALTLLLASALFIPIAKGIEILAYAYGRYKDVLLIGLVTNIPRVLLYVVLVPPYGVDGAALAFLGGTVIGFICSIMVASRMGMGLLWKQVLLILSLPISIGVAIYLLQLHWILGVLLVLGASLLGYIGLKIITRKEIKEIISSLHLDPILEKVWPFKVFLGD